MGAAEQSRLKTNQAAGGARTPRERLSDIESPIRGKSVDVSHRPRRAPIPPTPERLHARAMRYLERFATTGAQLRRVLLRRALRDAAALELDAADVRADVDAVVARVV